MSEKELEGEQVNIHLAFYPLPDLSNPVILPNFSQQQDTINPLLRKQSHPMNKRNALHTTATRTTASASSNNNAIPSQPFNHPPQKRLARLHFDSSIIVITKT
jgi:hypothetical protein